MAESHWKAKQSDDYQVFIGVKYLVRVIAAVEQRAKGPTWVRMEARDVPAWDDIVVGDADGAVTHVQVKRQIEPFEEVDFRDTPSKDEKRITLRNVLTKGREAGVSAAKLRFAIFGNQQVRFYRNGVTTDYGELSLLALRDLCADLRAGGVNAVVPSGGRREWWERIQKALGVDDAAAYALLRRFYVDTEGTEDQLWDHLVSLLGNWYASPSSVINGLFCFASRENRPAGKLTYTDIYEKVLRDEPRSYNPHGITVAAHPSGTGLRFAGSSMWSDSPRRGWVETTRLDVLDTPRALGPPHLVLLRAILHWHPGHRHLHDPASWWACLVASCATDGLGSDPPETDWAARMASDLLPCSLAEPSAAEFRDVWSAQMDALVWASIQREIRERLPITEVQRDVWARWHSTLDQAPSSDRTTFFSAMLSVASERQDAGFDKALRVGRLAVNALVETLGKALEFAALVDRPGRRVDLELSTGVIRLPGVIIRALALRSCSCGSGSQRVAVPITEALDDAAGDASVLLLPRSRIPPGVTERWIEAQNAPPNLKDGSRPVLILGKDDPIERGSLQHRLAGRLAIDEVAARLEEALRPCP